MTALYKTNTILVIRLSLWLSLIFFVYTFFSCGKDDRKIAIAWKNAKAAGITIPVSLLKNKQSGPVSTYLQVRLKNNTAVMLGAFSLTKDDILFEPPIPLSAGNSYEVFFKNELLGSVKVPEANPEQASRLLKIYPAQDTLPENLLKIYLVFSAPMREGEALKHITLFNDHNDTLPGIFLDLPSELWNTERTVLTLWLDPGRIKRDLIPNREMGNPLRKGEYYTLSVSTDWQDAQGLPLKESYQKKFIAAERDGTCPQPAKWLMQLPISKTKQPLIVQFPEPLDYYLVGETIALVDEKGNYVAGQIHVASSATGFTFSPKEAWHPGSYTLRIASYLEDLAGNNVNRLFDRDLMDNEKSEEKAYFEKAFAIGGK